MARYHVMSVPMRHHNESVGCGLRPHPDTREVGAEKMLYERGLPSGILTNNKNLGQNIKVDIRQRRTVEIMKTVHLLQRQQFVSEIVLNKRFTRRGLESYL